MIEINDQKHFDNVKKFAQDIGLIEDFQERIEYLDTYAGKENTKCILYKDFAPYSFHFTMMRKNPRGQLAGAESEFVYWFNGGLIYHGPIDNFGSGEAPTFAVTLDPTNGWSIHT